MECGCGAVGLTEVRIEDFPAEAEAPGAKMLPVVAYAPYGDDAYAIKELLGGDGTTIEVCRERQELGRALCEPVGALLLTQEALTGGVARDLGEFLRAQEQWSELPIVLLLESTLQLEQVREGLQRMLPRAKLFMLQRPLRKTVLASIVKAAVAARLRQYAVRDHLELQETLRRELNHRVKNILATVMSIFNLTKSRTSDRDSLVTEFQGRLNALTAAHEVMFAADYGSVSVGAVIERALAPFRTYGSRIECSGPDIDLVPEAGLMIALSLYELSTNASKYGALSADGGRVRLTWDVRETNLVLEWRETGGPAVEAPTRTGYGTTFMRAIFAQNFAGEATLDYAPEGFSAVLAASLDKVLPKP